MRQEKMWNEVLWCITLLAAVLQCVERQDMVSTWHRTFSGGLQGRTTCSISLWRRERRENVYYQLSPIFYFPLDRVHSKQSYHLCLLLGAHLKVRSYAPQCGVTFKSKMERWSDSDRVVTIRIGDSERTLEEAHKFVSNTDHPLCHSHVLMPSN